MSEIEISDLPDKNKFYLKPSKKFNELFINVSEELKVNTTHLKKTKASCVDDMRLIFETDKYNTDDLKKVYNFLKNDREDERGFSWRKNIQSISKLREKMPKLLLEANTSSKTVFKEETAEEKVKRIWGDN